jgi:hypothetical protein
MGTVFEGIKGSVKKNIYNVNGILQYHERVRDWCSWPYPGHPKGCPNVDKVSQCPSKIGMVNDIFDLSKECYFAVVEFNIEEFADSMKKKHPEWSDKQCRCCLYWQNTVRRNLRMYCNYFVAGKEGYIYTLLPEAMGVHVFKTTRKLGITLKRNPQELLYKVALIGTLKTDKYELQFRKGSMEIIGSLPYSGGLSAYL